MEIILAIVVASAVIFFGALISMGNERQRKAIDGLREQITLWAIQDLKIKREHLVHTVQIQDPLSWLNKIASKACGYDLQLQIHEMFQESQTLVCITGDGSGKVAFSPISPSDLRRISRNKKSRLSQVASRNPLLSLPGRVSIYVISVLNGGHLFDLELASTWKSLLGQELIDTEKLWIYFLK
jgi:hypothetical protein